MKISTAIKLFTSQLARRLTLVLTGNIFAASLGFISVLIITRTLSVSDFGLFNIAISIILIGPRLAALGMDTSMIKFASSYLSAGKTKEATQTLRTTVIMQITASLILAIAIFSIAPILAQKVFRYHNLTPLIRLAAFGVLFFSLLNYLKSVLYTYQLFKKCVVLQLWIDATRLSAVVILMLFLKKGVFAAVGIFAFSFLIGILLGTRQITLKLFSERKPVKNLLTKLISFSKWTFISIVCKRPLFHVGIFMLAKMLGSEAAGIYGLAFSLTYIFPVVIVSLWSVLLPEVSRFKEMSQFEKYIKNALKISLYLCIAIIPFLFLSRKIILFFFGYRYINSVVVFNWLLLSYASITIGSAIRSALYSLHKPQIMAFVDLFSLLAMIFGCYLLIPSLGVLAPAIMALIINTSSLGFLTRYVFKYIHKYKGKVILEDRLVTEGLSS